MATTPVPQPANIDTFLLAIENGANIALLALTASGVIPGGPLAMQLAVPLESALNSLITGIRNRSVTTATYFTVLAAEVDALNVLRAVPNLPTDVLTKIEQYSVAIENGMSGYMLAQKGYDASNYAPVTPIS